MINIFFYAGIGCLITFGISLIILSISFIFISDCFEERKKNKLLIFLGINFLIVVILSTIIGGCYGFIYN